MKRGECSLVTSKERCQMCDKYGHTSISCPWVYTRCRNRTCDGIRKLLLSTRPSSMGKKFFTCTKCNSFQWFDDVTSSTCSASYGDICFGCGRIDHLFKSCPWKDTPCNDPKCSGIRRLSISGTEHNHGISYLKCCKCDKFEWLSSAIASKAKEDGEYNLKVQVSLDGLCNDMSKKAQFKYM